MLECRKLNNLLCAVHVDRTVSRAYITCTLSAAHQRCDAVLAVQSESCERVSGLRICLFPPKRLLALCTAPRVHKRLYTRNPNFSAASVLLARLPATCNQCNSQDYTAGCRSCYHRRRLLAVIVIPTTFLTDGRRLLFTSLRKR